MEELGLLDKSQVLSQHLYLDINVTHHLVKIASRLYHHKVSGQPLKYEKSGMDKKDMESNEALYFKFLRQKIATLPEITQENY